MNNLQKKLLPGVTLSAASQPSLTSEVIVYSKNGNYENCNWDDCKFSHYSEDFIFVNTSIRRNQKVIRSGEDATKAVAQ